MITSALIANEFQQESQAEALYNSLSHTADLRPQCWVNKRLHEWEERLPLLLHHLPEQLAHCDIIHLQELPTKLIPSLGRLPQHIILDYQGQSPMSSPPLLYRFTKHYLPLIPHLSLACSTKRQLYRLANHPLFQGRPKYYIPQPINCQAFHARPRLVCKESLGIAPQMQIIAFRYPPKRAQQSEQTTKTIQAVCQQLYQIGILGLHIILLGKASPIRLPYPCSSILVEEESAHARARIYNAINILVHLSTQQENETRLLEAMACRLAIICKKEPSSLEHITNNLNGHLLEDDSPSALVHQLLILLRAPVLREHWGLHAQASIQHQHDERRVGALYKKLYNDLLNQPLQANQALPATA